MITIILPEWFTWFLIALFTLQLANGIFYLIIKWLEYRLKK